MNAIPVISRAPISSGAAQANDAAQAGGAAPADSSAPSSGGKDFAAAMTHEAPKSARKAAPSKPVAAGATG
ncbi:MAG: hypothetical protein WBF89_17155, partial [Steroidobacteraceae bacterium]